MTKKGIKKAIIDFCCSDFYLALLAFAIIFFWMTGYETVGTIVVVLPACIYMWIGEDLKPVVATIVLITLIYSLRQIESKAFIIMVAVLVPIIVASFAYNLIKFRKKRKYVKGKLFYPMAIAYITALCSGLGFRLYDAKWSFVVMGVGFGIYLLYFLCINCVKSHDLGEEFFKMLFYAAMIVAAETLIWFIRQPDFLTALKSKTLRLGWGMSNTLAVFFVMGVPALVYLGIRIKEMAYMVFPLSALLCALLLMTLSRGNILFGAIIIPIALVYGFIKFDRSAKIVALVTIGMVVISIVCGYSFMGVIYEKLFFAHGGGYFDDNGRDVLYKIAAENFVNHPVFGVGYFKYPGVNPNIDSTNPLAATFLWKVHNTVLQIMACGGVVGALGILPFYGYRYRLLIYDRSVFKALALLAVLAYELEGMVDVAFLSVHQLFFCMALFAAAEKEKKPPALGKRFNINGDFAISPLKRKKIHSHC